MARVEESGDRLAELRDEMTAATESFVSALNRRGSIALAIAEEKARRGTSQVHDLEREATVLEHVADINEGPFPAEAVQRVVQLAMDVSCELQATAIGLPIDGYTEAATVIDNVVDS
jgi:3-deoxy-7-phosphoheptulonate synthase / chorismate mutase